MTTLSLIRRTVGRPDLQNKSFPSNPGGIMKKRVDMPEKILKNEKWTDTFPWSELNIKAVNKASFKYSEKNPKPDLTLNWSDPSSTQTWII